MAKKKNQHYVPKFYLRNFSNNGRNIGMLILDKGLYKSNASIKSVAYSDFLYGEDGVVENLLSKIESQWAYMVRKIINKEFNNFSKEDDSLLYSFIAISKSRTQRVADINKYYMNYFKDVFENNNIKNFTDNPLETVKELLKAPNVLQMQIALENMYLLYDLDVVVLENKTRYGFITSDNPVVYYNQFYARRNYNKNYGVVAKGLQIFIPLSEKYMICLYDKDVYNVDYNDKYIPITSKSEIDNLNKLSTMNSNNQIFFHPDSKEQYIKSFKNLKIASNIEDVVMTFPIEGTNGEIIRIGDESIHTYINLKLFKIKQKYLSMDLPTYEVGLQRDIALLKK